MNRLVAFRTSIVAAAALMLSACGINSVPATEETAKAKWADVEAAFQERANLVPNLVSNLGLEGRAVPALGGRIVGASKGALGAQPTGLGATIRRVRI